MTGKLASVALLVLTGLLLPGAFIVFFQARFGYERQVVYLHLAILAVALSATLAFFAVLWALVSIERRRTVTRWLAVALTVESIALVLVYGASFLSNSFWGENINYDLIAAHVSFRASPLDLIPVPTATAVRIVAGAVAALLVLSVLLYVLYALASRRVLPLVASRPAPTGEEARGAAGALRALAMLGALAIVPGAFLAVSVRTPGRFHGEPLTNFFRFPGYADVLDLDTDRIVAGLEDQAARAAYPHAPPKDPPNVVLIFSDSLRADHFSLYGYDRETTPFLTSLARDGKLFKIDMSLATCPESLCGIASTMASRPFHQITPKNFKLYELLRDVGYRVNFLLAGEHRVWKYLNDFYGTDIDFIFDSQTSKQFDIRDDRLVLEGLEQVPKFSGQPNFFYFFLMSSHVIGAKWPEFQHWTPTTLDATNIVPLWMGGQLRKEGEPSNRQVDAAKRQAIVNRYDNGLLQADDVIRRIFAGLGERGYLDNAIVLVLGDHGDSLGEHDYFGHGYYLHQEELRIPTFFYDTKPDRAAYAHLAFGTQVDLAPTILDRIGLPKPQSWTGRSLLAPAQTEITLHQTRRGDEICRGSVRHDERSTYKYVRCGNHKVGFREEVYDLVNDPREERNLIGSVDRVALAELRDRIGDRFEVTINNCQTSDCR